MKNHIDNSSCKDRQSMPKKSQIAYYWREKSYEYFNYLMDWGEPSCWACGIWHSYYPDLKNPKASINEAFSFWNKHNYLERCHIIPKAHNGYNCEVNLVLLCKECHKASPDTLNPIIFQNWIKNRASWVKLNQLKLAQVLEELSYKFEDNDHKIMMSEQFKKYLINNAIPVGGKIALSTKIACLIEFKEYTSKSDVQKIYTHYDNKTKNVLNSLGNNNYTIDKS